MDLEPEPDIPCKDCRAYWYQYKAWLTYIDNIPTLGERALHLESLPKPPTKARPSKLVDGKPVPGGRCTTHWRAERDRKRAAGHARRVKSVYTIDIDAYNELKEFQGGKCAICQRATGEGRKRLAVDHDHTCCSGKTSCGQCVRGLLCSPCNSTLAHFRDNPATALRAWAYLNWPPNQRRREGGTWV
jgi:hypothetical protein